MSFTRFDFLDELHCRLRASSEYTIGINKTLGDPARKKMLSLIFRERDRSYKRGCKECRRYERFERKVFRKNKRSLRKIRRAIKKRTNQSFNILSLFSKFCKFIKNLFIKKFKKEER